MVIENGGVLKCSRVVLMQRVDENSLRSVLWLENIQSTMGTNTDTSCGFGVDWSRLSCCLHALIKEAINNDEFYMSIEKFFV